jgi:HEAT repeat protein
VPLRTQVRELLRSIHVLAWDVVTACRERRAEVVPEVLAILRDPSAGYNLCEQALALLEYLEAADAVPAILEIARTHAHPGTRRDAVRTLGAFPKSVRAEDLRALFDAARTEDEKFNCVQALGEVGDERSLPFLDQLARSYPDSLMIRFADDAAAKIRLENSPRKEVELVQALHDVEHPLRDWALKRIVEEKRSGLAPQLRHALDTHRKLPKSLVDGSFEFRLLVGLRDFGQPLSPNEQAFVARYGIENDAALPDE